MASLATITFSTPINSILPKIEASWESDDQLKKMIGELQAQGEAGEGIFTCQGGILRRKGKMVVGNNAVLRRKIIQLMHDSTQGGHSEVLATTKRVTTFFY